MSNSGVGPGTFKNFLGAEGNLGSNFSNNTEYDSGWLSCVVLWRGLSATDLKDVSRSASGREDN